MLLHSFCQRRRLIPFLMFSCLCVFSRTASAKFLNVPAQYATIQGAIDASVTGDLVLIADGIYTGPGNVDLDFHGKGITVTSQNGADKTIIDCQGSAAANHRGFYLHTSEPNAVISGLTIENGYESTDNGGAIYDIGVKSMVVQNCVIKNNTAAYGGGVYNSSVGGSTIVTYCTVTGNKASHSGGGLDNIGTVAVTYSTVSGNTATAGSGGMLNTASGGVISVVNCTINDNIGVNGGGVDNLGYSGIISISNCILGKNTADGGGGIRNNTYGGVINVTNCALTGNVSPGNGGAMYNNFVSGTISVTNCSVSGNTAVSGGGMYNYGGPIKALNTIFYGDFGGEIYSTVAPDVTYCDVQGGFAGTANINADPKYVSRPTDLHLLAGSPCLGAGKLLGAPVSTLDGNPRPNPPSIGAYELDPRSSTSILLASSVNPSKVGQNVIFTATVSGSGGTPTGTVQFTVDGIAKTPVTLSGGSATYSTSSLTSGTHTIAATYGGDTAFLPSSTTVSVTQTVHAGAIAYVSFAPSTVTSGANTTGTLTLDGIAPPTNAVVTITSSNPAAFYVPATAQINAGSASRTFTASARSVTATTNVTVTASWGGVSKTTIVTVNPTIATAIASVSFSPSSITGAGNLTGTLTLNGAAPAVNTVVQLTSSNPNALYVPATAQINSGLSSRTFTAVSKSVSASTQVTVTATWGGVSKTCIVTVNPVIATAISSVAFTPSSVKGGTNLTGALSLNGVAPATNAVVQLTSSNPSALFVPATAQINSGLSSRTFTAVSKSVSASTQVTVTASWGGVSKTTIVTVTP